MMKSRTLSISIDCPPGRVYDYVLNPENLPDWAGGFALSVRKSGEEWRVGTPQGPAGIRFAVKNTFGVLDHRITPLHGLDILVPMRVVPNDYGSEVTITLFCRPGATDREFAREVRVVKQDLETLKGILCKVPAAAAAEN